MSDIPLNEYIDLEVYDVVTGESYRALKEQLEAAQEHLSQIRPLRETEWAVLMREHDVLHEARRLSRSVGVINTTAELDRALKRYDEAVEAERVAAASTPAIRPEGE